MRTVEITAEAFQAASRLIPADTPLVMQPAALSGAGRLRQPGGDVTPCSGREACRQRYLRAA